MTQSPADTSPAAAGDRPPAPFGAPHRGRGYRRRRPGLNVLEDQVEHYYGSASATFPGVGTVTVPSPTCS